MSPKAPPLLQGSSVRASSSEAAGPTYSPLATKSRSRNTGDTSEPRWGKLSTLGSADAATGDRRGREGRRWTGCPKLAWAQAPLWPR